MRVLLRWVSDESARLHGDAGRVDTSAWQLHVYSKETVPQQAKTSVDCGVFALHFARCIATGVPVSAL
jgi:Ulp1 family protease